jgi:hypothetical protein
MKRGREEEEEGEKKEQQGQGRDHRMKLSESDLIVAPSSSASRQPLGELKKVIVWADGRFSQNSSPLSSSSSPRSPFSVNQ